MTWAQSKIMGMQTAAAPKQLRVTGFSTGSTELQAEAALHRALSKIEVWPVSIDIFGGARGCSVLLTLVSATEKAYVMEKIEGGHLNTGKRTPRTTRTVPTSIRD
uniref:Uncharacterized protein n=1 Tax=Alexandrium monilatum TaxID=311494 RepID=A0A7S4RUN7_9DINO